MWSTLTGLCVRGCVRYQISKTALGVSLSLAITQDYADPKIRQDIFLIFLRLHFC